MNFGIFGTYTVSILERCPYYRDFHRESQLFQGFIQQYEIDYFHY